ncbi:beta-mannanase [bacterium]|nr:MAG: beta-mannanase [bacterium]
MKFRLPLALFVLALAATGSRPSFAAPNIRLEAEKARLMGTEIESDAPGFSGSGYVTGFDNDGDAIQWTFNSPTAGLYDVAIRYATPIEKGFELTINGTQSSLMFPPAGGDLDFATLRAGKAEIKAGTNVIKLEKGWGYYGIDYLELIPAQQATTLRKPPATLVDPLANAKTRALMKQLVANYGNKMLSGQYSDDAGYLRQVTGKTAAIAGADLLDYSPSRVAHGAKSSPTTEQIIQMYKAGQIITLSWHWNAPTKLIDGTYTNKDGKKVEAPWWRGFDADASTFDVQKALADPTSNDYKLLLRDIDAIAVQLKKLQTAGVPVLWRPLHEADGEWFWWGAKGPASFKKLWSLVFNRMTKTHGLHNLIWVYTGTAEKMGQWYPGDATVDIFGVDTYPEDRNDTLSGSWEQLLKRFDGKKLLALTEFKGAPNVDKMWKYGVKWSYFVSWTGDEGTRSQNPVELKRAYSAENVANLGD